MIVSVRDPRVIELLAGRTPRRFPPDLVRIAERKLKQIDAAGRFDDLRHPPGDRLEALAGDRAGMWSIRLNRQWRVCFRWTDRGAEDVEIVDYH
jgi:proteic killer suppression protein